jgi:hypothetical protein
VFFFLAFLKFPVIRIQPGFRRLGLSLGLSYPIYSYIGSIGEEMRVKRSTFFATQLKPLSENNWLLSKDTTELQSDDKESTRHIIGG